MTHSEYFLKVGEEGGKRLGALSNIYNSTTKEFLLRNALKPGIRVLEVGGGTGDISCWIANKIGRLGLVKVIDSSSSQVFLIRNKIRFFKLRNIEVEKIKVENILPNFGKFDLVFCRFLLIHMQNPKKIIKKLFSLLNPGGKLIIEDCIFSKSFCFPTLDAFDRRIELIQQLFKVSNKNYDIGKHLYGMLLGMGIKEVKTNLVQPVLRSKSQKEILPLFLQETSDTILRFNLSNKKELIDLNYSLLNSVVEKSHYFVAGAQVCQVCVEKSGFVAKI